MGASLLVFDGSRAFGIQGCPGQKHNVPGKGHFNLLSWTLDAKGDGEKEGWSVTGLPVRAAAMVLAGETLFVLECEPAAYAALAANEAEKAAEINILEVRAFGSFGRVYIGGEEKDVQVACPAAVAALEALGGRKIKT